MRFRGTFTAPLVVIVVMFLVGASRFLDLAALSFHENICLAVIVIEFVTIVVPTVFYARLRGDRFVSRMRLRAFGPDKLFVIILAAVTLFFADVLLKLGLHAVGAVSEDYSIYTYYFRGTGETVDFVYSLITFVVIPSVSEELLFRGVLIPEYEDNGGCRDVSALRDVRDELRVFSGLFFAGAVLRDGDLSRAERVCFDAVSFCVQLGLAGVRRDCVEDH